MLPITIGLGLININLLIATTFAIAIDGGTYAARAVEASFRIYMLPQGMFSVAVAAVLFPTLSRLVAAGDMRGFRTRWPAARGRSPSCCCRPRRPASRWPSRSCGCSTSTGRGPRRTPRARRRRCRRSPSASPPTACCCCSTAPSSRCGGSGCRPGSRSATSCSTPPCCWCSTTPPGSGASRWRRPSPTSRPSSSRGACCATASATWSCTRRSRRSRWSWSPRACSPRSPGRPGPCSTTRSER